jgi:hypothetical protein
MPARRLALALVLLLLAGGCAGRRCRLLAGKPAPPPAPAPKRVPAPVEPLTPVPADYRIAGPLPANTAEPTPAMLAAESLWLRRLTAAGEGETPPSPPEEFSATELNGIMVAVRWDEGGPEVSGYQLDRAGADGVFSVARRISADAHEVVDGPLPAGRFSYRVRAFNDGGASAFAGPVSVELAGPDAPPSTPSEISVLPASPGQATVSWNNRADNAEYLRLERAQAGSGFVAIARLGPNDESFLDPGLELGATCSYRVIAGNRQGESQPSETAKIRLERQQQPPEPPVDAMVTPIAGGMELSWRDGSNNELRFVIERRLPDRDYYLPLAYTPRDATSLALPPLLSNKTERLRVRAQNSAGLSAPGNEVTVPARGETLATFIVSADPRTGIAVEEPGDPTAPLLEARAGTIEDDAVSADLWLQNRNPDYQLEGVYALVEQVSAAGIYLDGCDRGPESCSLDEGMENGALAGYQYTEDGYLGHGLMGAETETYGYRLPVRDLFPRCGGASVRWTIRGVRTRTTLTVNLYGRRTPVDFRRNPRFNPDLPLFQLETFAPGVSDGRHEPGASRNPAARPLHQFRVGEVVAVNVSLEAADWMESQPELGRLPDGSYLYWSQVGFALAFDPAVVRPLLGPVAMRSGAVLRAGIRDPLLPPFELADGWGTEESLLSATFHPGDGWVQALFNYPLFGLVPGPDNKPVCDHCFLEGFVDPAGNLQGPDPEPEAELAVVYFEVVGAPGTGSAFRLLPWPDTRLKLQHTSGTVGDYADDLPQNELRELSQALPATGQLPGDYQVAESYICVQ